MARQARDVELPVDDERPALVACPDGEQLSPAGQSFCSALNLTPETAHVRGLLLQCWVVAFFVL